MASDGYTCHFLAVSSSSSRGNKDAAVFAIKRVDAFEGANSLIRNTRLRPSYPQTSILIGPYLVGKGGLKLLQTWLDM